MANFIASLCTFIFFFFMAFAQANNDKSARLSHLSRLLVSPGPLGKTVVPIASGLEAIENPYYVVRAQFGTPPQRLLVAMDTSIDTTILQSKDCGGCSVISSSRAYDPFMSSTKKLVKCNTTQCHQVQTLVEPSCPDKDTGVYICGFNISYDLSSISAILVQDNITLGTDSITGFTFGFMNKVTPSPDFKGFAIPPQGVLGLGRGPSSLLSQTSKLYDSTFSYCLPAYDSPDFVGSLILGRNGQPNNISTTPLLQNPKFPSLYYVNLERVMVGNVVVNIPPSALAYNPSTGAGTVVSTGAVHMILVKPAYIAVRDEFRRQMGIHSDQFLGYYDTCFGSPPTTPSITLMFPGLNMSLPQENLIIHGPGTFIYCLAILPAPDNGIESGINIIGSFPQQNHRVLVDIPNSKLGVANELCT